MNMMMLHTSALVQVSLLLLSGLWCWGMVWGSGGGTNSTYLLWEFNQSLPLEVSFLLDRFTFMFLGSVCLIAGAVLLFSSSYMAAEKSFLRFHLLVLAFVLSMVLLIVSANLVGVLLGWDGLGLSSYLLVIYYQGQKPNNAGMITALTNRVGDGVLLVAIALMASQWTWGYTHFSINTAWPSLIWLTLLVSLAGITKSAQVPFSAWLPAAMAAPTPVSALVHSSTLVTAGIYLLFRFGGQVSGPSGAFLLTLGLITSLVAGLAAMFEVDMKKVIALSTLSQLGVMATALGLCLPWVAFFHLLAHAFFKALMFMSIGGLIHNASDFQDLRRVMVSSTACPIALSVFMVCNVSLMGLPFSSGFFSKDLLIELGAFGGQGAILLVVLYAATALTAGYSLRALALITAQSANKDTLQLSSDTPAPLNWANVLLFPWAVSAGAMVGVESLFCSAGPSLSWGMKTATLVVIVSGVLMAMSGPAGGLLRSLKATPQMLSSILGLGVISAPVISSGGLSAGAKVRLLNDQVATPGGLLIWVSPVMGYSGWESPLPTSTLQRTLMIIGLSLMLMFII